MCACISFEIFRVAFIDGGVSEVTASLLIASAYSYITTAIPISLCVTRIGLHLAVHLPDGVGHLQLTHRLLLLEGL